MRVIHRLLRGALDKLFEISAKKFSLPGLLSQLFRFIILIRVITTIIGVIDYKPSISYVSLFVFILYLLIYYLPLLISPTRFDLTNALIFTILFDESMSFIKSPYDYCYLTSLANLSVTNSLGAQKMFIGKSVFLISMYFVYYSQKRIPRKVGVGDNAMKLTTHLLASVSLVSILYVLYSRGGIMGSVLAWSGGRHVSLNQGYHWAYGFFETGKYLLIVLFIGLRKKRYLLFVSLIVLGSLIIDGSRSGVAYFLLFTLFLNLRIHGRIPRLAIMLSILLIPFFILFGSFRGNIQSGGDSSDFSFEQVDDYSISRSSEYSEIKLWESVPGSVDFLYGKTYLSAVLNWIPRSLWRNKPRGVGFYNANLILGKSGGGGVPVGQEAELYWNFSFLGLLLFGTFSGFIWRGVAGLMKSKNLWNNALAIYLILKFKWSTVLLVKLFQLLLPILIILFLLNESQRIIFNWRT